MVPFPKSLHGPHPEELVDTWNQTYKVGWILVRNKTPEVQSLSVTGGRNKSKFGWRWWSLDGAEKDWGWWGGKSSKHPSRQTLKALTWHLLIGTEEFLKSQLLQEVKKTFWMKISSVRAFKLNYFEAKSSSYYVFLQVFLLSVGDVSETALRSLWETKVQCLTVPDYLCIKLMWIRRLAFRFTLLNSANRWNSKIMKKEKTGSAAKVKQVQKKKNRSNFWENSMSTAAFSGVFILTVFLGELSLLKNSTFDRHSP